MDIDIENIIDQAINLYRTPTRGEARESVAELIEALELDEGPAILESIVANIYAHLLY